MNANKIHAALEHVHREERSINNPTGGSRTEIAPDAIERFKLDADEADVLRRSLNIFPFFPVYAPED